MKLKEALNQAGKALATHGVEEAHLESELLLRQVLNISRLQLYLEPAHPLDVNQEATFKGLLKRRLGGEPSAYIRGYREFYRHDFYVDRRVLIPRPESELLVDRAIHLTQDYSAPVIADIGTGCGAIAISLALSLSQAQIYATDISAAALEVARLNCHKHGVADRVHLLRGDLLEPLPEAVDIIVANLPYVKQSAVDDSNFEPPLALNGGGDGTTQIRRLCRQAVGRLGGGGSLLLEMGWGQERAVADLINNLFPTAKVTIIPDLAGIPRVISATLP